LGYKHSEKTRAKLSESAKGKNHSEKTRAKMSESAKGKNHSEKTLCKISVSKKGENHPLFGKQNSAYRASPPNAKKIEVTDIELNTKTIYDSTGEAARALNIAQSIISMYFNRNQIKPLNGRYICKKL
jgi:group I intron endonuclease